jgi:hypothetical protein
LFEEKSTHLIKKKIKSTFKGLKSLKMATTKKNGKNFKNEAFAQKLFLT